VFPCEILAVFPKAHSYHGTFPSKGSSDVRCLLPAYPLLAGRETSFVFRCLHRSFTNVSYLITIRDNLAQRQNPTTLVTDFGTEGVRADLFAKEKSPGRRRAGYRAFLAAMASFRLSPWMQSDRDNSTPGDQETGRHRLVLPRCAATGCTSQYDLFSRPIRS